MGEAGKISSSLPKTGKTGAILDVAIKGLPPVLQRFYKFTKEMAQKFSRHLSKDRTDEFIGEVVKEFKNVG